VAAAQSVKQLDIISRVEVRRGEGYSPDDDHEER
jgi:hypothetical protein